MNQDDKIKLSLRVTIIAGVFSMVVCILMLLNFWQLKSTDPLESELLASMVTQLGQDSRNEGLKEDIRKLDLMTRKAYFTKQWQIRTGGALLLGGTIVMVIALRMYHSLKEKIDAPEKRELNQEIELFTSRKWLLYSILSLFVLSLAAAYLSDNHLSAAYSITMNETAESDLPKIEEVAIRPAGDKTEIIVSEEESQESIKAETATEDLISSEKLTAEEISDDKEIVAPEKSGKAAFPSHIELIAQFPSFRGPYGIGISNHKNLPVDWDGAAGKNVLWKVPVPSHGYNSPVIWGNRLFLTGAENKKEMVYCFDRNNGTLLWQYVVEDVPGSSGTIPNVTEDTGLAAPTTATDGNYVYAIFATGDLVCLDYLGNLIWAKNLGIPDNHYGHSSSLLMWRGMLYIQFDTNKGGKLQALDALTGVQKWQTKRDTEISWSSPILANVGDHYELVLTSNPLVAGYDPMTGKELWGVECLMGEVGPSAGFGNNAVYAANEYASLVAIRPGASPEILWESNEYLPEVSSPVAANGMVFIATSYGVVACHDAATGEILWEYEADQGFYASPLIADGKVYALDMDGKMHIFNLDKELKIIGTPELGEKSVCTPAFTEGRIYLRTDEYLYCIGK